MKWNIARKLLLTTALIGLVPASAAVRRVYVYRPWGWGWGWGWHDPYWSYGPYPPAYYHPDQGEVKLDTKAKNAEVFVDGAFAGTAGKLKTMWLQQGPHSVEIREPGGEHFAQQIYVMSGKTTHIHFAG